MIKKMNFVLCIVAIMGYFLTWGTPVLQAACACQAIELRSGPGNSSVYCTEDQADISSDCVDLGQGQNGCDDEKFAYQCPLGPVSIQEGDDQRVGWNYEIAVTLTDGSNAGDCDHAQIATRTGLVNLTMTPNQASEEEPEEGQYEFQDGPEVEVVNDPAPYPRFRAINAQSQFVFGADGYTEDEQQQNLNINAEPPQITWIDTPDFNWALDDDETGEVKFEFMAWTDASDEDSDDNCWCRFTIERTWNGQAAGGNGLQMVAGVNCTLAQGEP